MGIKPQKINKRYDKLTVINIFKRYKGNIIYKCQCDCGNIKNIDSRNLNNHTKSCGCLQKDKMKKHEL